MTVNRRPSQPRQRFISVISAFILLVFVVGTLIYSYDEQQKADVCKKAPEFTLDDLEGNPVSLSDFRDKVVFINFWASWCDACREETPALQEFHERYGDQVIQLGINLREPADVIEKFMAEFGANYRVLRDKAGRVADAYRLRAVPESWFIDPEGIARVFRIGPMTFEQMQAAYETTTGVSIDVGRGIEAVFPSYGNRLFAVAGSTSAWMYVNADGLWVTQDGGQRWAKRPWPDGIPSGKITSYWPFADVELLALDGRLWRLDNSGVTPLAPDLGQTMAIRFVVGDETGSTLYLWAEIVTEEAGNASGREAALFHSGDHGTTWHGLGNQLRGVNVYNLSIAPDDSNRIYLATGRGVYGSDDGGRTWWKGELRRRVYAITPSPVAPNILLMSTDHGLWMSMDGGFTSHPVESSPARVLAATYMDKSGQMAAISPNGDVYVSDSDASQWIWGGADW